MSTSGKSTVLQLTPRDTVAVALTDLAVDAVAHLRDGSAVTLVNRVPFRHKVNLVHTPRGRPVIMYGTPIGSATADIQVGEHVHEHNLGFDPSLIKGHPPIAIEKPPVPPLPTWAVGRTFNGYLRPDGRVGTRNVIAIISTVNCSATVVQLAAAELRKRLPEFPNIDDIVAITHGSGCGIAKDSPQHQQFADTIAGAANHPNVSATVLVGLGCEVAQFGGRTGDLIQLGGLVTSSALGKRVANVVMQAVGGTDLAVQQVIRIVETWLPEVNALTRTPQPISKLVLGLNCGGSDGASGLTANPLLGRSTDILVAAGATSVLAETPETIGAHIGIAARAESTAVGEKFLGFFSWWEQYVKALSFMGYRYSLDNNPSPGNKASGLTTIVQKSMGAATKGGTTALRAAYNYAEPVGLGMGFTFMNTPGLDQVSVTGLLAGGCNVIAFTTGNGSCFGTVIAPTIKLATNTPMYTRMESDMDFNAGVLIDGADQEMVDREFFEMMIAVASGQKTKSERLGVGKFEFQPWDIGPTF